MKWGVGSGELGVNNLTPNPELQTPDSQLPTPTSVIPTSQSHSAPRLTALKLKDIDATDELADRKSLE